MSDWATLGTALFNCDSQGPLSIEDRVLDSSYRGCELLYQYSAEVIAEGKKNLEWVVEKGAVTIHFNPETFLPALFPIGTESHCSTKAAS